MPVWRRALAVIGATAALIAGSVTGFTSSVEPAGAVTGSEFNPGYIISDQLFYDGAAMTAAQIEAFLAARGSSLDGQTINFAGKPIYISSRTGNKVCDAVAGGTMSVSELIYRAQVACSISAKVILVTMQKEQGLITNPNPSEWAISHAMGMACPDTAPCDPGFAGLGNQIVSGTAQLRCYKICNFAKQPGVQYIQYHPDNARCGGTTLYVQNYATAALYSYTPYQPNSAALANLGGTGDSCSSYGNRNFWYFYSNWFGSTGGGGEGPGAVAISQAWEAQGGKTGPWGNRMQYMDCRNGVECGHVFENVIVGWTPEGGIKTASGTIMQWVLSQGIDGIGYPDSDVVPIAGGSQQSFSRSLVNIGPTGTFALTGATRSEHARLGGVAATAGWPTGPRSCTYSGGACLQPFQHAYISEVGSSAYSLIDSTMLAYFDAHGGAASLGVPNSQLVPMSGPNGAGTQQAFQSALVSAGPAGTFLMKAAIRTAHGNSGGVNESLGWPTGEQVCATSTSCAQNFQNGLIYASSTSTRVIPASAILTYYRAAGGLLGALGAPLSGVISMSENGGGTQVAFENGLVESGPAGTFTLSGPIRDAHGRQGGAGGALGWPTAEQVCDGSGCTQTFQFGTLLASTKSGVVGGVTDAAIAAYYQAKGGPTGSLGYPVSATIVMSESGGGKQVAFQNGLVESSPAGTFTLSGAIRDAHGRQGGVGGPLGWPTAEQVCDSAGCSQTFQNGTLLASTAGPAGGIADATIAAYYQTMGGPTGSLGYPVSGTIAMSESGGGKQVAFERGLVESSPAGTFTLSGVIRDAHGRQGGVGGPLGWPTTEQVCDANGCTQTFQNGTLFAANSGAAGGIADATIAAYYQTKGGPTGSLGYPVSGTISMSESGGGKQVAFQNGLVESSSAGTFTLAGAIRDAHGRQGGVGGPLGWPTAEQACDANGCTQTFQNGSIAATTAGTTKITPTP